MTRAERNVPRAALTQYRTRGNVTQLDGSPKRKKIRVKGILVCLFMRSVADFLDEIMKTICDWRHRASRMTEQGERNSERAGNCSALKGRECNCYISKTKFGFAKNSAAGHIIKPGLLPYPSTFHLPQHSHYCFSLPRSSFSPVILTFSFLRFFVSGVQSY